MDIYLEPAGRIVWTIRNTALQPDVNLKIDWSTSIASGVGTKHQRHTLLHSAKLLYLSMYGAANPKRVCYSPATLSAGFLALRALVRWMVARDIWRFADLTPDDIINFVGNVKSREAIPAIDTIWRRMDMFRRMWEVRGKYSHPIQVDVSILVTEIQTRVKTRTKRPWPALDDDIALALVGDGLAWLEEFGGFVAGVVKAAYEESKKASGISIGERKKRSKRFYDEVGRSSTFERLCNVLETHGSVHATLGKALSVTEGACVFLLLILLGFRVSELVALNVNCLATERSDDGFALAYVTGPAAKRNGRMRRWIAGDPVPKIIGYLIDLTTFRAKGSECGEALLVQRSLGATLFRHGSRRRRWSQSVVKARLDAFATDGLRKGAVQAPRIHPHMLRKTFAQLAVRRDKSRLGPVAAQLGHAYRSFTDNHYVRPDHELAKLLSEHDRIELARGLEQLLTCDGIGGKAASALAGVRSRAVRFRGRKSLHALVSDLIAKGVSLAPCDWGYCVYSRVYSACRGDDRGPNEVYRSPDVCSGCRNFMVTPAYRPWWEARARNEEEFLKTPNLSDQTRILVEGRLRNSLSVLERLISPSQGASKDEEA